VKWASASTNGPDLAAALGKVATEVAERLAPERADVVLAFVGPSHAKAAERVPEVVRSALGAAPVVGCTAGGVIGGGREHEQSSGVALMAGRLPDVEVRPFHVEDSDLPDADAPPSAWQRPFSTSRGAPSAIVVVADPYSIRTAALLQGLDFAFPSAVKVGGLASGASRPGEQVLFAGDRAISTGAVGLALAGDVVVTPAVAQGCRGIGPVYRITACEGGRLDTLDGKAALEVVKQMLADVPERDRNLARSTALFLGVETDPFAAGDEDGPWLVRNLVGVDRATGALQVGEWLRPGRRVRFHVRDAVSSTEDLERTLEATKAAGGASPAGALLFSCLGRGMHLYGVPDHDTRAFRAHFGDVPVGGFFCSGEIGPVGGETRLHGYTSSFGVFRAANGKAGKA
jgi:small ligand-binding sensory domain FIST